MLPLLLLLPLLTPITASSHRNILARRNHADLALRAQHSTTMEARMARRAAGKRLASRAAQKCRAKGSLPSLSVASSSTPSTSTSIVASSSSTSTQTSTSSADPTTTSTTGTTSTTDAGTSQETTGSSYNVQVSSGSSSGGNTGMTPNGNKAGISGGDAFDYFKDHIGWWYDWTPNPSGHWGSPMAVPMLWGAGTVDSTDSDRFSEFLAISSSPAYIIGFEEPDCYGSGSAGIDVSTAAGIWNNHVAPHGSAGSLLLSPSMCHQAAETGWLQPFAQQINRGWDITNLHINKNSASGIQADLDHYWNTYGKPMWITEFACVDDSTGFVPCTDQSEINNYIWTAVQIFESDSRVAGYAYSNGAGLGNVWPLMNGGQFSESGQTYLAAVKQYH
ncbi:hypothetical protein M231_02609 [Tremella mesenterica]|uniref:Asl1-like glycosyl hydrolase catalytic domain-containing protein n=1 Tax=Tremella mesenterica TaxID=5217 RepID=A0A4Q1BQE8_TREME|nr:uncharacterized protein TREMEDRAFT_38370 [Tremella mesenterica DSM 1558]EIW70737.1 hypothetical protein TREMEDRAFT_38370 [Tremella mesenterica DSM 1558]RXK40151.1 hypothetical protein M231_02609 [Tremella mesenterica]